MDFTISNPVVGVVWLVGGLIAAGIWLAPDIGSFRREHGIIGTFRIFFGDDTPEAYRLGATKRRIFIFFAIWLGVFVVLDLIW